jgi:putative transposase
VLNIVKVRLYPNEEQKTILEKTFGSVRFVYNQMLEKKIKAYEKDKTSISCFSLIKELPKMKKSAFEWLKEVDSTALQQSIKNMDRAYQGFFT